MQHATPLNVKLKRNLLHTSPVSGDRSTVAALNIEPR
jgi:hypothetical protein